MQDWMWQEWLGRLTRLIRNAQSCICYREGMTGNRDAGQGG